MGARALLAARLCLALTGSGALARVRPAGPLALMALVTRQSAEALGLAPGRSVVAQLEATELRAFPAPRRAGGG
ncbi:MAG TPA: TOBE domain-containing protein [Longimicrobiales bacterium]